MSTLKGMIIKNDIRVYQLFNLKLHNDRLFKLFTWITQLGSSASMAFFVLLAFLLQKQLMVPIGQYMVLTALLSQLIVHTIKRLVNRPRPYIVLKDYFIKSPLKCVYSFPSGHTACAYAIGLVFATFFPAFKALILSISLLVALSRIILGVHYPTDVLIGGTISYISYISILKILPLV